MTVNNPAFPDQVGHKYAAAIQACAEHGLVLGRDDGLFHPDEPLTRGEFCEAMARTYVPQAVVATLQAAGLSWAEIIALFQLGTMVINQILTSQPGAVFDTPPVHLNITQIGQKWAVNAHAVRE